MCFLQVKEWRYGNYASIFSKEQLKGYLNIKSDFPYLMRFSRYIAISKHLFLAILGYFWLIFPENG